MAAPTAASLSAAAARVAARYDLVLRLRPDLCFCGPLDLGPVLRSPGSYWMPWAAPHAGLAFDQIAVGSPTMIAQYAAAYSASVTGEVAASTELYPEAVMWRALERTTLVQSNVFNAVVSGVLLNSAMVLAVMTNLPGVPARPAKIAYHAARALAVGAAIFGVQVPLGVKRVRNLDAYFEKFGQKKR